MPTTHRQERARSMVDAAIRVIRREGAGCSIDDVAREIGVTRPVVYRYFGSRDGLAAAVAARVGGELRDTLLAEMTGGGTGRDVVRRSIDAYVGFIERDPELYRYLMQGGRAPGRAHRPDADEGRTRRRAARPGDDADAHEHGGGFVDALGRALAAPLGDALRAAGRDSGAAEPWAFAVIGMIGLAGDWWMQRRTMSRARLVDYLTDLAWDGMAPSVTPAVAPAADDTFDQLAVRRARRG